MGAIPAGAIQTNKHHELNHKSKQVPMLSTVHAEDWISKA
jgi:hypothetical protein